MKATRTKVNFNAELLKILRRRISDSLFSVSSVVKTIFWENSNESKDYKHPRTRCIDADQTTTIVGEWCN